MLGHLDGSIEFDIRGAYFLGDLALQALLVGLAGDMLAIQCNGSMLRNEGLERLVEFSFGLGVENAAEVLLGPSSEALEFAAFSHVVWEVGTICVKSCLLVCYEV